MQRPYFYYFCVLHDKMPISAFLFDAYYKGASCGHCNNEALNTAEVYNMTGVQQDAGGTGRIFPN